MGLTCPREPLIYCICCNELDQNSEGGDGRIDDEECSGGALTSGINGNSQGACSGISAADEGSGGYVQDGYPLGVRMSFVASSRHE